MLFFAAKGEDVSMNSNVISIFDFFNINISEGKHDLKKGKKKKRKISDNQLSILDWFNTEGGTDGSAPGRITAEQNSKLDNAKHEIAKSAGIPILQTTWNFTQDSIENGEGNEGQNDLPGGSDEKQQSIFNGNELFGKADLRAMDNSNGIRNSDVRNATRFNTRANYRITAEDRIAQGGPKIKCKQNITAIRLLKRIESEGRLANKEEQVILAKYTGWGGIPQVFSPYEKPDWKQESCELKELLTTEEWESARASTLNAHYTDVNIIEKMYQMLQQLGFKKGRILEPACGVGNFFGMMPEDMMNGSKLTGIELDSITGRIAKQLYQNADIRIEGYEKSVLTDEYFDIAISNVPFGSYTLADPQYDKHKFFIHDYFFAKSLDKVRPGGLIMFITSKGTMDKRDTRVREYISERADLIAAIRLPNTTFKQNAGTEVTTDIIILKKKDENEITTGESWINIGTTPDGVPVNEYYLNHPDMLLGRMVYDDSMYGNSKDTALIPDGVNTIEALCNVVEKLPSTIYKDKPAIEQKEEVIYIPSSDIKDNAYAIIEEKIYQRQRNKMVPVKANSVVSARIRGMIGVRDAVREVFKVQLRGGSDEEVKKAQAKLNDAYDRYVVKYGYMNDRENRRAFIEDPDYYMLSALEISSSGAEVKKADIFTKRTIEIEKKVTHVDRADEALSIVLNEKGYIDLNRMIQLTGKTVTEIIAELKGLIYKNPQNCEWETADAYLSGNVREKLKLAIEAAQEDPEYNENVSALKSVQPVDLDASEIDARMGATWIPVDVVKEFIVNLLEIAPSNQEELNVAYIENNATWVVDTGFIYIRPAVNTVKWGTVRKPAVELIEDALNLRQSTVYDTIDKKSVLNKRETIFAREKQDLIKDEFRKWLFATPERRERLVKIYNERFNSIRLRKFDGSHLTFPGMNKNIQLRPHQKDAVARGLYGGNLLLAHAVGTGKTYIMCALAMELRRLGLSKKPLFVVPNSLIDSGQFAKDFLTLYPQAKILAATTKDFEKENRKKLMSRIATNDWDAVLIGQSSFTLIPVSIETQEKFLKEQIDKVEKAILAAAETKNKRTINRIVKQLECSKKKMKAKLEKLLNSPKKDNIVTFEELGVDYLFVDEAHGYKNLAIYTKLSRIAGVQTTEAQKTEDLYMKTKYVTEINNGRGLCFATGTPVSNSICEVYTFMRYLAPKLLKSMGVDTFDSWASTFGEIISSVEIDPTGQGYRVKQRFAKFFNVPELMIMFRSFTDIITEKMVNLPKPELEGGKPIIVQTVANNYVKEYVQGLVERAEKISKGAVDKSEDNMLMVTNDGRKVALDPRLVDENAEDYPDSKLNMAIRNIYKEWEAGKSNRLTQLVFCDLGTPGGNSKFNVYEEIKQKLVKTGIPAEEIAFIHDADTPVKRVELFRKVRSGEIRILIGSTNKCSEGVNIQDRLVALHELDVPWKPAQITQREGRILRQGNMVPELCMAQGGKVRIYRYATKGTFDAYSWQTVETKAKFIDQIMRGESTARTIEDIDENILSYAEIKAISSGNPLIMRKVQVDSEIQKLQMLESSYNRQKYHIQDSIMSANRKIAQIEKYIENLKADIETVKNNYSSEQFMVILEDTLYTERKKAGLKLIELTHSVPRDSRITVGKYAGLNLEIERRISFIDGCEYYLHIVGKNDYECEMSESDLGNAVRMENELLSLEKILLQKTTLLKRTVDTKADMEKQLELPFEHEQRLKDLKREQIELNNKLNLDKHDLVIDDEDEESDGIRVEAQV